MSDVYILLKDLVIAGKAYKIENEKFFQPYGNGFYVSKSKPWLQLPSFIVENNPEWFSKEAKPPEMIHVIEKQSLINDAKELLENYGYSVRPIVGDKRNGYFWAEYNSSILPRTTVKKEEPQSVEEKAYSKEPPINKTTVSEQAWADYMDSFKIDKSKLDCTTIYNEMSYYRALYMNLKDENKFSVQDMEKCFKASRIIRNNFDRIDTPLYSTFDDYIKSI